MSVQKQSYTSKKQARPGRDILQMFGILPKTDQLLGP